MAIEPTNTPAPIVLPVTPADLNAPKTYTEAELTSRIEAARQEEKQKLYSEVESLKNQLKDATLTSTERDTLKVQLTEASQQLAAIKIAQTDKGLDPLLLAKQVAEDTRRAVSGEFTAKLDEMQRSLKESQETQRRQSLAAHRQSLIASFNGRCIAAMIVGNTTEELDAAATESAKQYEEIAASANPAPPAPAPGGNPPPVNPRANGGGLPPAPGLDSFKRTSDPAAYGKTRQATLAAVRARFG